MGKHAHCLRRDLCRQPPLGARHANIKISALAQSQLAVAANAPQESIGRSKLFSIGSSEREREHQQTNFDPHCQLNPVKSSFD